MLIGYACYFFYSFSSISGYSQYLVLGWPTMLLSPSNVVLAWSCLLFPTRGMQKAHIFH